MAINCSCNCILLRKAQAGHILHSNVKMYLLAEILMYVYAIFYDTVVIWTGLKSLKCISLSSSLSNNRWSSVVPYASHSMLTTFNRLTNFMSFSKIVWLLCFTVLICTSVLAKCDSICTKGLSLPFITQEHQLLCPSHSHVQPSLAEGLSS